MSDNEAPKPRRTRKPASVADAPADATDAPEVPNAVLVIKTVGEDGGIGTSIQVLGNVQITEVQTLLELGLKAFRNDVGL